MKEGGSREEDRIWPHDSVDNTCSFVEGEGSAVQLSWFQETSLLNSGSNLPENDITLCIQYKYFPSPKRHGMFNLGGLQSMLYN